MENLVSGSKSIHQAKQKCEYAQMAFATIGGERTVLDNPLIL